MKEWLKVYNTMRFRWSYDCNDMRSEDQFITDYLRDHPLPSETYEIDFGGHIKCKVCVCGSELEVEAAMNGWGDGLPSSDISVVKLDSSENMEGK